MRETQKVQKGKRGQSPKKGTVPFFFALLAMMCVAGGSAYAKSKAPPPAAPSPFKDLADSKGLRTLPQFVLIDDFNSAQIKNLLGFEWQFFARHDDLEKVKLEFLGEDALRGKKGRALFLSFSLPSRHRLLLRSPLGGMDVSQAQGIAFKCRVTLKDGTQGSLKFRLKDLSGKQAEFDFGPVCRSSGNQWKEAVVPRAHFSQLDWNQLSDVQVWAAADSQNAFEAEVWIDELAFYGTGEVKFNSLRDNLLGFPAALQAPERQKEVLSELENKKFLLEIARDTWKYFENAVDKKTQLPVDHIRIAAPGDVGAYTTPTNLAMYFLACISAYELDFISKKETLSRIRKTLESLRTMKRWKGFHYNFYNTTTLQVTRNYISSVDSAWLAAAFVVLRQAFPKELGKETTKFLEEVDFYELYDPGIGQIRLGYDAEKDEFEPYHYGLLATEARIASFVGIGKGDLPREHWWLIYRTPPESWDWQNQKPAGKEVTVDKVTFFQGFYHYQNRKYVPSWGGSMFEFLMPPLVLKEKELAPQSLGANNRIATEIQIDYALNRQGYPIWGLSPASTSSGRQWRYGEYGVKYLGVKGYRDEGIVSPYAAFLALETLPEQAIDNLRKMLQGYDVYGGYGFYDSVNVRNAKVNYQYLALDQGMILAAITNYLKNGIIKEYFHRDKIAHNAQPLLELEQWFD